MRRRVDASTRRRFVTSTRRRLDASTRRPVQTTPGPNYFECELVAQVRDMVAEKMGLESGKQVQLRITEMDTLDPYVSIGSLPSTEFMVVILEKPLENY